MLLYYILVYMDNVTYYLDSVIPSVTPCHPLCHPVVLHLFVLDLSNKEGTMFLEKAKSYTKLLGNGK